LTPDQLGRLSEITNPIIRQRFAVFYQLPTDLQESMFSEQISSSIWQITKDKYNLPDSNISVVARIIGLIFLGELPIKNFIVEIKNKLNVDVQKAQAIAQDINQAIFQPVRQSLMQVHGLDQYANQRMNTNDTNTTTNIRPAKPVQTPQPTPPQLNRDTPPTARPASYYNAKPRNTVDLRRVRKGKYNGFFT
ncbi:MAG: hypothetical protein AAB476_00085, partial [Patescibacteria group bacterium]